MNSKTTSAQERTWRRSWELAAVIASTLLGACTAGTSSGAVTSVGMNTPAALRNDNTSGAGSAEAKNLFQTNVLPLLMTNCGDCHQPGGQGPSYLSQNPDVYTSVKTWPGLVNVKTPGMSLILTKGAHNEGTAPALTAVDADKVKQWITAEGGASNTTVTPSLPSTAVRPVNSGENVLSLTSLGMTGSVLTFRATRSGSNFNLNTFQISAGTTGARLTHPRFVEWIAGQPQEDASDKFAAVDISVEPSTKMSLGSSVTFTGIPQDAQVSFKFQTAAPTIKP